MDALIFADPVASGRILQASGLPAAPLAHINGLKAAERELWRLLIGSGSNGTCGGGGTSAMRSGRREQALTRESKGRSACVGPKY